MAVSIDNAHRKTPDDYELVLSVSETADLPQGTTSFDSLGEDGLASAAGENLCDQASIFSC
jgi:hypothetical protein